MKLKNNDRTCYRRSYEFTVTNFMRYLFSQHFDITISRDQKLGEVGLDVRPVYKNWRKILHKILMMLKYQTSLLSQFHYNNYNGLLTFTVLHTGLHPVSPLIWDCIRDCTLYGILRGRAPVTYTFHGPILN